FDHWVDGAGRRFEDVIGHMDIVIYPVDHTQKPFARVDESATGVAMSTIRRKGNSFRFSCNTKAQQMAKEDEDKDKDKKKVLDMVSGGDTADGGDDLDVDFTDI